MSDQVQPCLFTAYDHTVRQMMDTVDQLRMEGIDSDIDLPQIVVIGDQSSGKSSTLEALSGIQLPRGSDIVTRCPLVMSLRSSFDSRELVHSCKLKYNDRTVEIDELDMEQIGDEISKAQNELAGKGKGISRNAIFLQIVASGVPDLTLVDLPGIARVPMEGQPKDIADQTRKLIKEYITNPASIILVMAACDADIATNEALNMAKGVDPNGTRTLGVLTKADRIEHGNEGKILKLLKNVASKEGANLAKGYTLIKCRTLKQLNAKTTLDDAVKDEDTFFKDSPMFSSDRSLQNKLGTKSLAKKLTTELQLHLKKIVPTLKQNVNEILRSTRQERASLGAGVPTDAEGKRERVGMLLSSYVKTVSKVFEGDEVNPTTDINLWHMAREEFDKFTKEIENVQTAPVEEIRTKMRTQRGSEPLNYMRSSCSRSFICGMLFKCEGPAKHCMYDVSSHVDTVLESLAEKECYSCPSLMQAVKEEVESIRGEEDIAALKAIDILFEMENIVYASDRRYVEEFNHIEKMYTTQIGFEQASAMYRSIRAHFNVARKRLMDTLPMVILHHYFKILPRKIERKMIELSSNPDSTAHLQEADGMKEKREALNTKIDRLEKASKCLTKF